MCDTDTYNTIINLTPQPKLDIKWLVTLDKYSKYNRSEMTKLNIWTDFQMSKALVMKKALEENTNTLFIINVVLIV